MEYSFSMKSRHLAVIAKALLVVLLAGCVKVKVQPPPTVPETLKVPAGQVLLLESKATGVQIYQCQAAQDDPARFEWVFKAPEAELFDSGGKQIGKHYAGPAWESNDGSRVVGEVVARDNGPDPSAIPWLLLKAKSTSGNGIFGHVQSIQRVSTVGGKAPAEGCNQAQFGKETRVDYKASYYFYGDKNASQN
jgi:hypothetical protein